MNGLSTLLLLLGCALIMDEIRHFARTYTGTTWALAGTHCRVLFLDHPI